MTIALVGTVVNACDAVTGFNAGNVSADDPYVQGSGCVGLKATGATSNELYTTTISGGPYNFASGGGQFGYHVLLWLNSKSPLTANQGFQIVVGNGTSRGRWYVPPSNYTGGFVPRVVNTARAFDVIAAGSWTTGGNPGQLSSVTQVGGAINPAVSIMGSFNNVGLDQITVGLGIRADAGTSGAPNTFEAVRAQDQDTSIWGWCRRTLGAFVFRGKLYMGPASGSATSYFVDSDFTVVWASELVASGFYEFNARGTDTHVSFTRGVILAEDPSVARWSLVLDGSAVPAAFSDTDSVWEGGDQITLRSTATLTGTKLINCTRLTQNSATLDTIAILSANVASGTAFLVSNDPSKISDSAFTAGAGGHAIEITTPGTYAFSGNTFSGYGLDGSNDAAIYNNSGGLVTLNISGGTTPTVRNGAGASTTLNSSVTITVTPLATGSEVRAYRVSDGIEISGTEASTGSSYALSLASGVAVDVVVLGPVTGSVRYTPVRLENRSFTVNQDLDPGQRIDRNFRNP